MTDEIITIEKLQELYTKVCQNNIARQELIPREGDDLKRVIKYHQALRTSVVADIAFTEAMNTFLTFNPGVDIDAIFAEKGL